MKSPFIAAVLGLLIFAVNDSSAQATPYSAAGVNVSGIGDQIGGTYDLLTLAAFSGAFTDPGTYELNTLSFTEGPNTPTGDYTVTGTTNEDVTIDGTTITVPIDYSAYICNCTTDTLSLSEGAPIAIGNEVLTINSLGPVSSTAGVAGDATVFATFAVPEPASLAVLASAIAGLVVTRRRWNI